MFIRWVIMMVCTVVLFSGGKAQAEDLRLGWMPISTHFWSLNGTDIDENNESHGGLLIEYEVAEDHWIGYLNFENSEYDHSDAVYYLRDIKFNDWIDYGYAVGVVTGYDVMDPGPMLIGHVTFGQDHLKGRLVGSPIGVIAYQLMLEF